MKRKFAIAVLIAVFAATACGGGGARDHVVKIGFIGPLTGGLAPFGAGMRKSIQLAVDQAKADGKLADWTVELSFQDDAADAKQGAAAAQKLASDPEVGAVIGTLNSSVASAVQPVLDSDSVSIAMVSPANTNPNLTQGLKWQTDPKRPHDNYFRVVTTDREQGQVAAKYAYEELDRRKAVLIHDKKVYGQGLANVFADNFKKLGGTIAKTIPVNPGEGDYKSAITDAKGETPDLIFYGGEFPEAGVIAKNMGELDLRAPEVILMGGDGVVDKTFLKLGGQAAQGHYATTVGASADFLDSAKQFVTDYKAKYKAEDWAIYGPTSYDSANIIIEAFETALADKDKIDEEARAAIVEAIAETDYEGAFGKTTFNEFGDTTNRILTINKIEGDDFKPLGALTAE